jgi:hypothetical protein
MTARQRWWTAEDVAQAIELRVQGHGPVAIGREVGRTAAAVGNFLYRCKRRGRPPGSPVRRATRQWPAERVARVLQLYAEDWTYSAIAAELGCTKNAIAGVIHRTAVPQVQAGRARQCRGTAPPLPSLEERLNWPRVQQTGCRWIDGDPAEPGWAYCGEVCMAGSSWCAAHAARLYQSPKPAEIAA